MIIPTTIASLETPVTEEQAKAQILTLFAAAGFAVTSWQSGGIGMTVAQFLARLTADFSELVVLVVKSGFLDKAAGEWLTWLARAFYDTERKVATFTTRAMTLTSSAGADPQIFVANELWVVHPASGLRFNNTTGGTLPSGATEALELQWIAEFAGPDYNIPNNTTLALATPIPGITVTNPPGISGSSYSAGSAEETDPQLRQRCRDKWASLAQGDPEAKYRYWALTIDEVRRVYVDATNPRGPGTLDIYVAGASGPLGSSPVAAAQAAVMAHRGDCALPQTYSATDAPVTLTGTVYYRSTDFADEAAALAALTTKLDELAGSIDIGGEQLAGTGYVFRDAIIGAFRSAGLYHVNLTAPAADVALTMAQCATFDSDALAFVAV